jgi:hypothetical protein
MGWPSPDAQWHVGLPHRLNDLESEPPTKFSGSAKRRIRLYLRRLSCAASLPFALNQSIFTPNALQKSAILGLPPFANLLEPKKALGGADNRSICGAFLGSNKALTNQVWRTTQA